MKLKLYKVDAFASQQFEGNPAAICPLDEWLPDQVMQNIAMENNLSETAFLVKTSKGYHIRWFTPVHEVALCGHATLASAFVIFEELGYSGEAIEFESRSGLLVVKRDGDWLEMNFPSQSPTICEVPEPISKAFRRQPQSCLKAEDYIVVFDDEEWLRNVSPDLSLLSKLDLRGVAITARSRDYDFVVRFFAPGYGINEDPVTGSAFTQLVPYWTSELNKTDFHARQVSKRGGEVKCSISGDRVLISGKAVLYLTGEIQV